MSNSNKAGFFIIYSEVDVAWADWINWHLRREGFYTIMQKYDITAGADIIDDIYRAPKEHSILVVLSSRYSDSSFSIVQWTAALKKQYKERQPKLILIRTDAYKAERIRDPITYIDLVGLDKEAAVTRLLEGVESLDRPIEKTLCPATPTALSPEYPGVFPDIWNIPHGRNHNFTGRDEIIEKLHKSLSSRNPAASTQAISGLGGVGKTQLVLEYAYRYKSEYSCIWWMRSENPTVLATDFTELAAKLDLPEADAHTHEEAISAVKSALRQRDKWLLIFDNATTPNTLQHFIPQGEHKKILITSRQHNWDSIAEPIDITGMSRKESIGFIKKRVSQIDEESMDVLADAAGDLPLALEHATAYINATGRSLPETVKLYALQKEELLIRSGVQEYSAQGHDATVATSTKMLLDDVAERCAEAKDLLNLCAFFASDDIRLDDIVEGARHLPERLEATVNDKLKLDDVKETLRRYALVTFEGDVLSVHRLVQDAATSQMDGHDRYTWSEAALYVVNQVYPSDSDDMKTWYDCGRLVSHTIAVTNHALNHNIKSRVLTRLLNQHGLYLAARGSYEEAESLMKQALYIDEELLGEYHPDVAIRLNNLAGLLQATNRTQEAEPLMERVIELFESAYGKDHPNVATSINNLALLFRATNRLREAEPLMRRALQIDEEAFDRHHPNVAIRLNNLAELFQATNRLQEAEPLMKRALQIFETNLGPDHPYTKGVSSKLRQLIRSRHGL